MYDDIIIFNKYNTNVYTIVVKCFASTFFVKCWHCNSSRHLAICTICYERNIVINTFNKLNPPPLQLLNNLTHIFP